MAKRKQPQKAEQPKPAEKKPPASDHDTPPSGKRKKALLEGQGKQKNKRARKAPHRLGLNFWDSIAYTETTVELRSPYSQYIFNRISRVLAVNAYLVDVYPLVQSWSHSNEIIRCMDVLIGKVWQRTEKIFAETEQQIDHMRAVLGLDGEDMAQFSQVVTQQYAITTPRVRQYLSLLRRLDRAAQQLHTLWMAEGGISSTYMRSEVLRLRASALKSTGAMFRQSDRIRRVIAGRLDSNALLKELTDEMEEHYGRGLKEVDDEGHDMCVPGERELTGPLVGVQADVAN